MRQIWKKSRQKTGCYGPIRKSDWPWFVWRNPLYWWKKSKLINYEKSQRKASWQVQANIRKNCPQLYRVVQPGRRERRKCTATIPLERKYGINLGRVGKHSATNEKENKKWKGKSKWSIYYQKNTRQRRLRQSLSGKNQRLKCWSTSASGHDV